MNLQWQSRHRLVAGHTLIAFIVALGSSGMATEESRPVDGIMDNSFLVEEAYNQESGIVQHIFTGVYSVNRIAAPGERRADLSFTQEWPAYGQEHQLSYTVPFSFERSAGNWTEGVGDILLNYRYQAYFSEKTLTAFAPRFSLVLPTGDEKRGFGNGTVGYQWNLPFSTTIGERTFFHANAGLTFLSAAGEKPSHDFLNYNLGGSFIYCVSRTFNLMLEWVGLWSESAAPVGGVAQEFGSVISPGMRYAVNRENGSQLVVGLGIPLGLTRASSEIGALFYLSFEHRMFGKETLKE